MYMNAFNCSQSSIYFAPTIEIHEWTDHTVRESYPIESQYCKSFWLPQIGPTTYLLLNLIAKELENAPSIQQEMNIMAAQLGIDIRLGKNGPLWRAIRRAQYRNMITIIDTKLYVKTKLPKLTTKQLNKLEAKISIKHNYWEDCKGKSA